MELQRPLPPHAAILRPLAATRHRTTADEPIYPTDRRGWGAIDDMPAAGTLKAPIRWSKLFDLEPVEEADGLDGGDHEEDDDDHEEDDHEEMNAMAMVQ